MQDWQDHQRDPQLPTARSQRMFWIVAFLAFFLAALPGAHAQPRIEERIPASYDGSMASVLAVARQSVFHDDEFSSRLFVQSVRRYAEQGDEDLGGFMLAFEEAVHIAAVRQIDGPGVERQVYPYISSFNLQYALGKHVVTAGSGDIASGLVAMQILLVLAMAAVVASIAAVGRRWFGTACGVLTVAIFVLSPMMLTFGRSLYWALFLNFIPFLVVSWLYPRVRGRAAFFGLVCLVAVAVMIKSLAGYEFLSNVALGAALPIVFYELRGDGRITPVARRIVLRSLAVGVGSVAGFMAGAALHVAKAAAFFGSWYKGFQAIYVPFSYSTLDQAETGIRAQTDFTIGNAVFALIRTYAKYNFQIMLPLYGALAISLAIILARKGWRPAVAWEALAPNHRALAATFVVALMATLSWELLAITHSLVHPHINWMTSYMFANIFVAWLLGMNIRLIHDGRGVTTSGMKA